MRFLWPEFLWLLFLAPALVALYVWVLRRRRIGAVVYPSLGLVRPAMGKQGVWKRHLPPFLFLIGLIVAILASARPSALMTLPSHERVIMLAIDVSLSMRASDVPPSRIQAAKDAAKEFVQGLPADVRVGIVSFAGTATVAQAPTRDREELVAAIERLQLDRQTAIGSGILVSLATLFPDDGIDIEPWTLGRRTAGPGISAKAPEKKAPEKKAVAPVEPGSNTSKAIILLTDGRRTTGPLPTDAARLAAERGVKVYTVGFGTSAGASVPIEGYNIFMMFDEETLRAVAELTRAEYFHATSAAELKKVYETLSSKIVLNKAHTEIAMLLAAASALLLLLASGFSLLWTNRTA
jgi:Ca-activated chloride channel family protein